MRTVRWRRGAAAASVALFGTACFEVAPTTLESVDAPTDAATDVAPPEVSRDAADAGAEAGRVDATTADAARDASLDAVASPCEAGTTTTCYTGPVGTLGVGVCKGGVATCKSDGAGYGPCAGETVPGTEDCGNSLDEDCDGDVDESGASCVCKPGATRVCYTGPAGTSGVGTCKSGTQTCLATGIGFGDTCAAQVEPSFENCDNDDDEDCDGATSAACHSFVWGFAEPERAQAFVRRVASGDLIWARIFGGWLGSQSIDVRRIDATDGSVKQIWSTIPLGGIVRIGPTGEVLIGGSCLGNPVVGSFTWSCTATGMFLLLMDSSGTPLWFRNWASGLGDAAFDENGDIALMVYASNQDFGDGARNGSTLLRMTRDGTFQWSRQIGGTSNGGIAANATRVIVPINHAWIQHYEVHEASALLRNHTWNEPGLGASATFDPSGEYWLRRYGSVSRLDATGNQLRNEPVADVYNYVTIPAGGILASRAHRLFRFDRDGKPVAETAVGADNFLTSYDADGASIYVTGYRESAVSSQFRGGVIGAGNTFLARLKMYE